mgnify:FL=1
MKNVDIFVHQVKNFFVRIGFIMSFLLITILQNGQQVVAQTEDIEEESFTFLYNIDDSLPDEWIQEFETIMTALSEIVPIDPQILEVDEMTPPLQIYAWNSAVSNPFPQVPNATGACICGDGSSSWMILEIPEDEFRYDSMHRYSVIVHEYWHVYQIALAQYNADPIWLWEGAAKIVEELYVQQFYGRSDFDNKLVPVYRTAIEIPQMFEEYVDSDDDMNYNGSAFMVLALVKKLQEQGISEERAFEMVLKDFQEAKSNEADWQTVFEDVFSFSVEDFYADLSEYPLIATEDEWINDDMIVDAESVLPSKTLKLEDIFVSDE